MVDKKGCAMLHLSKFLWNWQIEILNGFQDPGIPSQPVPQWSNPTDFIIKFSLYQESPNSITSTETSAIQAQPMQPRQFTAQ